MPADFVPFVPAARPAPPRASSFTALDSTPAAPPSSGAAPCASAGPMQVELKREGGRITQIRLQCRCGEVIELDCEY